MRHSLATAMIRAEVDPLKVQRMLRHRSYSTTQRYVHLVADDLRSAHARLRLLPGDEGAATHADAPSG
jgi:site-specific recombinase XerD